MMVLRERAGYRGGLTIESGGGKGPLFLPLLSMVSPSFPVSRGGNGELPLAGGAGAGRGQAKAVGGVILNRALSRLAIGRRRGGAGPGR